MKRVHWAICLAGLAASGVARPAPDAPVEVERIEGRVVYSTARPAALLYEAKIAIDADGAPNAYHPEDTGLDELSNGGRPGDWWALVTDAAGTPIIQGPKDPFPGYYVSMTSLADDRYPFTDTRRWVDSTKVPFIVLPPILQSEGRGRLGDFAMVINRKNGRMSAAIVADTGPPTKLGEGSIALATALDVDADARRGGADDGIVYVVFSGSGNGKPRSAKDIRRQSGRLFKAWGGMKRLDAALPALPPAGVTEPGPAGP
ncbi:MAG TPA: glycoside hydrolase family 75 protein [Armatimonadota bacterium]